jgi:thermitase
MHSWTQGGHRAVLAAALSIAALVAPTAGAHGSTTAGPSGTTTTPARTLGGTQPRGLLVRFRTPADAGRHVAVAGDKNLGSTESGVTVVGIEATESVAAKLAEYRSRSDVVYAEPNYVAHAFVLSEPSDPSFGDQWALAKIQAVAGWSLFPGTYGLGGGATISIVDTGVDLTHPDLVAQLDTANAANCLDASGACVAGSAVDEHGHGTHTTGIAAATANDGVGVAGIAFSSRVIPVKALDALGSGTYAGIANGILWAAQHGARVISLSLGGYDNSQTLCDAVATATNTYNALVVAAAGNDGISNPVYPAACPEAIGVAATDVRDKTASWSNFGRRDVFVSAPGVRIYSTYPGDSYESMSGTSMATPYVAGLAAHLFGQDPTRTPADVKRIIASSADKVGGVRYGADRYGACATCTYHPKYGYGRINVARALGGPDFAVAATPAKRTIKRGRTTSFTLTVAGSNGFDGAVTLTPSGLPRGSTWAVIRGSATQQSALRIRVPQETTPGRKPFVVTASADGLTRSVNLSLDVTR